jgi:hypothetical protein
VPGRGRRAARRVAGLVAVALAGVGGRQALLALGRAADEHERDAYN